MSDQNKQNNIVPTPPPQPTPPPAPPIPNPSVLKKAKPNFPDTFKRGYPSADEIKKSNHDN